MKDITISNYKCLEKIQISDLKRVNLFTGRNNTGKSSVLEAISLLVAKGDLDWISYLLENRERVRYHKEENYETINIELLSTFFTNRNSDVSNNNVIKIISNEHELSLKFARYIKDREIEDKTSFEIKKIIVGELFGFEIQNDKIFNGLLNLNNISLRRKAFISFSPNLHLIDTKGSNTSSTPLLWDKIILTEKEDLVIEALQIIEPKIIRLSFVGEGGYSAERHPIVKLKDTESLYPLQAMGDGINRILNIILALVNSENGFLFIDEFENGLHYSVQEQLWKVIFTIANRLDIQVFVTTHSNDSINSFAKILDKSIDFEGSLYRLDKKNNKIKANLFSEEEIKEAALQQINLR